MIIGIISLQLEKSPPPGNIKVMDVGTLLKQSGRLVWQHKFIWVLGFLTTLTGFLFNAGQLFWGVEAAAWGREIFTWLQQPDISSKLLDINLTPKLIGQFTFWSIVLLFVVFIGFWLVATWAEAAIIQVVRATDRKEPVSLTSSLAQGSRWLARFVAIDAVAFFPWFILALGIMLLFIVLLLVIGYQTINQAEFSQILTVTSLGMLCLLPLTMLLIPVSWLTLIYRTLAFRDAALLAHDVRQSVRHTWQVIKRRLGHVAAVLVVLWGIKTAVSWGTDLLFWPVLGLTAVLNLPDPLIWLLNGFLLLVITFTDAFLAAYIAVAWTLAYAAWARADQS